MSPSNPTHPQRVPFDRHALAGLLHQPRVPGTAESPDFSALPVYIFDQVTSTNSVAWTLMTQATADLVPPAPGLVVIAQEQQAGRGQRGRQWSSPPGGLYLSVALRLDRPATSGRWLTMSSAWGIAVALRDRQIPVQIKWLNDLVVGGQKLGGILTETRIQGERIHHAVIGVGINWSNPVPETGITLQTVLQTQPAPPPIDSLEALAAIVLGGLQRGYDVGQGEAALVSGYETLLANVGQTVEVEGRWGEVRGVAADGRLRVRLRDGDRWEDQYLEPGSIQLGYGRTV